jgi:hypothetical protein
MKQSTGSFNAMDSITSRIIEKRECDFKSAFESQLASFGFSDIEILNCWGSNQEYRVEVSAQSDEADTITNDTLQDAIVNAASKFYSDCIFTFDDLKEVSEGQTEAVKSMNEEGFGITIEEAMSSEWSDCVDCFLFNSDGTNCENVGDLDTSLYATVEEREAGMDLNGHYKGKQESDGQGNEFDMELQKTNKDNYLVTFKTRLSDDPNSGTLYYPNGLEGEFQGEITSVGSFSETLNELSRSGWLLLTGKGFDDWTWKRVA